MKKFIQSLFMILTLAITQGAAAQTSSDATITGLNSFAFDLYNKVNTPGRNAIFSPYSLSSLLGILTTGSAGNTHAQLLKVLHLESSKNISDLNTHLDQINAALAQQKPCTGSSSCNNNNQSFIIGNALWADDSLTYKPSFLNSMQQLHTIDFFRINFSHAPDQAADKINAWVASKTKGYIKNLIGNIPASTRLILTNAIYFKGLWTLPFEANNTKQQSFFQDNGHTIQAPMMNQEDKFAYAENDMLQMLVLNYSNSTLSMAVLLPKKNHNLHDIQQALNTTMFSQLVQSAHNTQVILSMPKFKIESTFDSLSSAVQGLGLTDAFGGKANFAGMTSDKLYISSIIQKALIQVDEKGTVAAAATGIMMATAMAYQPMPVHFTANHPFLFVIFDSQSNLILFIGQLTNPVQA